MQRPARTRPPSGKRDVARSSPEDALEFGADAAAAEQTSRRLWRMGQRDPFSLIRHGALKIDSPYVVNADGTIIDQGRTPGRAAYQPMRPNPLQERVLQIIEELQRRKLPCSLIGVKPRRGAFSTICQAIMFVRGLFISPSLQFTIAHVQDVAEELLGMCHTFYDRATWLHPYIEASPDRQDSIGFRTKKSWNNRDPDFQVFGSRIQAITADPVGIQALRGKGAMGIQLSERDFYQDEAALSKALTGTLEANLSSIIIEESTSQGKMSSSFAERVNAAWERQGGCNFDDPRGEFRYGRSFDVAIFFGMHEDPRNIGYMQDDVPFEDLVVRLDEYERRMWNEVVYPFHLHRLKSVLEARRAAAQNFAYRRARLAGIYKDDTVKPTVKPFRSTVDFIIDYPFTLGEAFSGTEQRHALQPEHRAWLKKQEESHPPKWRGNIRVERGRRTPILDPDAGGRVWLWKKPEECRGRIVVALDPGYKQERDPGKNATDPSFAVACDWETGEIIATYVSFEGPLAVVDDIFAFLIFLSCVERKDGTLESLEKRLPLFGEEAVVGGFVTEMLVNSGAYNYPEHRVFRHPILDKKDDIKWSDRFGIYTSNERKVKGVELLREWIENAMDDIPEGGMHKLIIYDPRINRQFEWFVGKDLKNGGITYQAEDKHGSSEKRFDDGVMGCVLICIMIHEMTLAGEASPGVFATRTTEAAGTKAMPIRPDGTMSAKDAEEYEDAVCGSMKPERPAQQMFEWTAAGAKPVRGNFYGD